MAWPLAEIALIASISLILAVALGYRFVLPRLPRRRPSRPHLVSAEPRSVSLLVPCHNEAVVIEAKLESLLALDYPKEKLQILVLDDGSTDETAAIVRRYKARGVELLSSARIGKASVLHRGILASRGEILISTDADSFFGPETLQRVVPYFDDPEIGGVAAAFTNPIREDEPLSLGNHAYWRSDTDLKILEARVGSAMGMVGQFLCFRATILKGSSLTDWHPPKAGEDTALSFFLITKGFRIAFCPDVLVSEEGARTVREFVTQKRRVVSHGLACSAHYWRSLASSMTAVEYFCFFNRRILTYLVPMAELVHLSSLAYLSFGAPFYRALAATEAFCIAMAVLLQVPPFRKSRPSRQALFFMLANFALILGWWDYLTGSDHNLWQKVARRKRPADPSEKRRSA